jgi:excisionase family DNA binding protein
MKYSGIKDLPELPGWLTFGEAAKDLGLTSERVRQMAQEGKLHTAHRIGRHPIGVVEEAEIHARLNLPEQKAQAPEAEIRGELEALREFVRTKPQRGPTYRSRGPEREAMLWMLAAFGGVLRSVRGDKSRQLVHELATVLRKYGEGHSIKELTDQGITELLRALGEEAT